MDRGAQGLRGAPVGKHCARRITAHHRCTQSISASYRVFVVTDIAHPDTFVSGCRTCLDITHFYEERRHPSIGFAWSACPQNGKSLLGAGGFGTICTTVCNRCDSYTACRLCRLEPDTSSLDSSTSHSQR